MKKSINNKGITLIILVIIIVVLLILAGVSISMLNGENGILNQSKNAKYQTEVSEDKEKIAQNIVNSTVKPNTIGQELKDIEFNTTEERTSIYDSNTGKRYATDWFYMTPENSGELKLHYSYIVNYDTGEIVVFDKNIHRIVSNNLKCIKEGLVYAADPKNMTDGDSWGDAILHNFKKGEPNSGWSENALMFDGIDDGIEVKDKTDYSKGITLEMYFTLKGQTSNQTVQILMMKRKTPNDGFFMFLGNMDNFSDKEKEYRRLTIYIGGQEVRFITNTLVTENVPIYITYTYNPSADKDKGILYVNGEKTETTNLGDVNNIVKIQNDTNIQIGSDIYKSAGQDNRYPFKGEIYAGRIYNRPLSEQEVKYNYNATVK